MSERLIILGSGGFIGSELVKLPLSIGLERKDLDLLSSTTLPIKLCETDTVVYAAGIPSAKKNDEVSKKQNLEMVNNLIKLLGKQKIKRIIFLSSVEVYGNDLTLPLSESSPLNPQNLYAEGKVEAEEALNKIVGMKSILRLPGIFGKSASGGFLKVALEKLKTGSSLELHNNGNIKRDFVDIKDLTNLVKEIASSNEEIPLLNIARGESLTLNEYIGILGIKDIKYKETDQEQFDLIFDTSKIKELLPNFKFTNITESLNKLREHC